MMTVQSVPISRVIPYEKNPRKNDESVELVANSIQEFGFQQPIVVDKEMVVIVGHTRLKAAKSLGLTDVPVVIADNLSDEQVKAYRLADNKVAEFSEWDFDLLNDEINDIFEIDMESFGFDVETYDPEEEHAKNKEETQQKLFHILNCDKGSFQGEGYYDIPILNPVDDLPDITEWIGFNYVLSDKSTDEEKRHKGVHFFIDDYQFERLWNDPEKYVEYLKPYGAVAAPDFSPYMDMPNATQIFNHYRKHWVGAFLQSKGVTVIPTIRASMDERSFDWYLDGEPKDGIVIISSMWSSQAGETQEYFREEFFRMVDRLEPLKIFVYGREIDFVTDSGLNIEYIKTFTQGRFNS